MTDVRKDVTGCSIHIHRNAAKRVVTKVFFHDLDADMGKFISDFWAEDKHFCKRTEV